MKKLRISVATFLSAVAMMVMIVGMYLTPNRTRWWRHWWARLTVWLSGAKVTIDASPDPKAQLFVINHRNLLDIVLLEAVLPGTLDPCWIAKKEIAKIPIFGRILDAPKMLVIDRENRREIVKLLKNAAVPLAKGRPLMIFPEGTRNKGDGLLTFKAGAKMLAEKHQLLVQPVVIQGSDTGGGPIHIRYLPAINPKSDPQWYTTLEEQMRSAYDAPPAEA